MGYGHSTKTNELARCLTGKSAYVNFEEPAADLERTDNRALRAKILSVTQHNAKKLGIWKSTLHHLRKKAQDDSSFKVYRKIREMLEPIGERV